MALFEEKFDTKGIDDTASLFCKIEQAYDVGDHVEYVIRISRGIDAQQSWTVKKRYSDFALLDNTLRSCGLEIPFPPKKLFGNRDRDFIAERQNGLQTFLQELQKIHLVALSLLVRNFLDPVNYKMNVKEVALQHISMLFRSENKWEVIEPAPDIGWRINKAYFFVKNNSEPKSKYILSWTKLGSLVEMENKDLAAITKALSLCGHPYIYPVSMCNWNESSCISVAHWSEKGTLRDLIYKSKPKQMCLKKYCKPKAVCICGLESVKVLGRQILEVLKFLHDKGLPYGNLHAGNVMVSNNTCQLMDVHSWYIGTPSFYRPFYIQLPKIQTLEAVDVYSFGHLIYEMSMGFALNDAVCDNAPINCPPEIRSVIQSILSANACQNDPLSVSDLLNHSLFKTTATSYNKPQLKLPTKVKDAIKEAKAKFEQELRNEQKMIYQHKRLTKAKEFHLSDEEKRKRRRSKMKQLSQQMSEAEESAVSPQPKSTSSNPILTSDLPEQVAPTVSSEVPENEVNTVSPPTDAT